MEKLETPLTWALAILMLGYFTLTNCCKIESNDQITNGFSWVTASNEANAEIEITNDESAINMDSISQVMLQENENYLDNWDFLDDTTSNDKKPGKIITVEEIKTEDSE